MTARTEAPPKYNLPLDESDRQLVLLALAALSLESPGFLDALNHIAGRIDAVDDDGRARVFDAFRAVHATRVPEALVHAIEDGAAEAIAAWLRVEGSKLETEGAAKCLGAIAAAVARGEWRKGTP